MAGEKGAGFGAGWLMGAGGVAIAVIVAFFALRPAPPEVPVPEAPAPVTEAAPAAAAPEAVADSAPAPEAPPAAPAAEATPEAAEAPAEPPAERAAAAAEPAAEPVSEPPAAPVQPDPPRFDTVRVTPDGGATVAGRAAPGAEVAVLVDAETVAMATANAQGSFATLFTLPPSAAPRLLTLRMRTAEGVELASSDQVVLAAIAPAPAPDSATGGAAPEVVVEAPAEAADEVPAQVPAETPAQTPAETPAETPAAILLTAEGVRVLQTGTQDPAGLPRVTIDAISYTPEGEVRFAGRGLPGAVVRLYLDDNALADLPVAADGGWGDMVPGIAPGLYALRADMIDGTGSVLARFATPFRRETAERLAMAAGPKLPVAEAAPGAMPAVAPETPPAAAPETTPETAPESIVGSAPATVAAAAGDGAAPATATPENAAAPVEAVPAAPVTVTVQPGFTLWGIAQDSFGSGLLYVQLFEVNRDQIRDPDLIYPGQVFTLPKLPD